MASLARILASSINRNKTVAEVAEVLVYKEAAWVPVVPTNDEAISAILDRLTSLENSLEDRPTDDELGDYSVFENAYNSTNPD